MLVLAVDPGMTTGVGMIEKLEHRTTVRAFQSTDVLECSYWIRTMAETPLIGKAVLLIEDFVGGGYRTSESNHTLKVIGHFQYSFPAICDVILRTPQQRLKGTSFLNRYIENTDADLPGPHGHDALKHCFSYLAENGYLRTY